jgi:outer membrane immunogenic protein
MKAASLLGTALLSLALGYPALAADLPRKAPPPVVEVWNWTGFYVGVNGGYSWGEADTDVIADATVRSRVFRGFGTAGQTLLQDTTVSFPGFLVGSGTTDVEGWVFGGQAGYNWQSNQFVFGIEADLQATGQDGSITFCTTPACGAGAFSVTADYKLDWFGTLRARAGVLVNPRVLLYATGGLAVGHFEADYTAGIVGLPPVVFSDSKTKAGWAAGAGVEAFVAKNWLFRVEYLFMDLGDVASGAGATGIATAIFPNTPGVDLTTVVDTSAAAAARTSFHDHILRAALSYKF